MSTRQFSPLHPDVIEYAYRHGYFPMPHPETGEILWFDPNPRAIIPLDQFHVSRSLRRSIQNRGYRVSFDTCFNRVVDSCAGRLETWITDEFKQMYSIMFHRGLAHAVEIWKDEVLVGGVFGLQFNGVFNGESMFSTATDASKIALYALVEAMKRAGMQLLEVQFLTNHLTSLGAVGLPSAEYHDRLKLALKTPVVLEPGHFVDILSPQKY